VLRFAEQAGRLYTTPFPGALVWCGFYLILLLLLYWTNKWLSMSISIPSKLSDPTDLWLHYPHTPRRPVSSTIWWQAALLPSPVLILMLRLEEMITSKYGPPYHYYPLIGASTSPTFTRAGCILLVLWTGVTSGYHEVKRPDCSKSNALGNHSSLRCALHWSDYTMWYYIHLVSSVVFVTRHVLFFSSSLDQPMLISLASSHSSGTKTRLLFRPRSCG